MKNGDIRVALASAELIKVHEEPSVLAAFVDVTERKRMQEALVGKELELRQAQALAHVANCLLQDLLCCGKPPCRAALRPPYKPAARATESNLIINCI